MNAPKRMPTPAGRLDVLAEAMLEAGLKTHGDPAVRVLARMAKPHISQALLETLGPGSKAGELAIKLVNAANDFQRSFLEAQRQIDAEERKR